MEKQKRWIIITLCTAFITYSFVLYKDLPQENYSINHSAADGKLLWQKYNCNACHQLYGLGGFLGPDLTNVYSKRGEAYIEAFLQSGTQTMPDFKLTSEEKNLLIAYLASVDRTGNSDPRQLKLHFNGTIGE